MTNDREDEALDELAKSIADGSRVEWERLAQKGGMRPDEIAALRCIAEIGDEHRNLVRRASRTIARAAALHQGFEILEEVGRGAFGRVLRAKDRSLERIVALKILDENRRATPDERARFLAEARALASLDHPNIVRIHSVDEHDGALRLSLEFIDGSTLQHLVESAGPLSEAEAIRVGVDLCRALATIHARGLIHRDVKPANIMRATGGRIVLLDFGLVRTVAIDPSASASRASGLRGTPIFMAPEQFDADAPVERQADLYALGVTLYWLVTGTDPWGVRADLDDLRHRKSAGRLVPLTDRRSDLSPGFAELVRRATNPDPAQRFESAGAMEEALRSIDSPTGATNRATSWRFSHASRCAIASIGCAFVSAVSATLPGYMDGFRAIGPKAPVIHGIAGAVVACASWIAFATRERAQPSRLPSWVHGALLGFGSALVSHAIASIVLSLDPPTYYSSWGPTYITPSPQSLGNFITSGFWWATCFFEEINGWVMRLGCAAFGALLESRSLGRRVTLIAAGPG